MGVTMVSTMMIVGHMKFVVPSIVVMMPVFSPDDLQGHSHHCNDHQDNHEEGDYPGQLFTWSMTWSDVFEVGEELSKTVSVCNAAYTNSKE